MADSTAQHCQHDGCKKAPSFGFRGGTRQFCSSHKRPGMEYLKHAAGDTSETLAHAQAHVPRGLNYAPSVTREPDLNSHHNAQHCQHDGCKRAPSFGFPGGERQFCSSHKRPGMVYLKHAAGDTSETLAHAQAHVPRGLNYAPSVAREPDLNAHHTGASHGHPHCHHAGCTRAASYGWPKGEPQACSLHKGPAMVFLQHSPAAATATAAQHAADHVPRGLEYIPSVTMESDRIVHSDHPHCKHPGCTKAPSYGFEGKPGTSCFSHKRPGMVFLRKDKQETFRAAAAHIPSGLDYRPSLGRDERTPPLRPPPPSLEAGGDGGGGASGGGGDAARPAQAPEPPLPAAGTTAANTATAAAASSGDSSTAAAAAAAEVGVPKGPATPPDLAQARQCVAQAKGAGEDITVGAKYLANILRHPGEPKFRCLKKSNRKFFSEVWLNGGMRALFLALGFREGMVGPGTVALGEPLAPDTLVAVDAALKELMATTGKRPVNVDWPPPALGDGVVAPAPPPAAAAAAAPTDDSAVPAAAAAAAAAAATGKTADTGTPQTAGA